MKILVFGAHPDDEVLGCGGSMAKWIGQGHELHVRLFTDNFARHGQSPLLMPTVRGAEKHLGGYTSLRCYGLEDQQLEQPLVTLLCEESVREVQPDLVVTHSHKDLNSDHRVVAEATAIATRPHLLMCSVIQYPAPGSNNGDLYGVFTPRLFVSLSTQQAQAKLRAFGEYQHEQTRAPSLRSHGLLEAQLQLSGAMAGGLWAEAFEVQRWCL